MNFGPKNNHGQLSSKILGYRASTSLFGTAITIVGGTNRVPSNCVCVFDWTAKPVNSGGKFGDKGGNKSGSNQQYNYTMAAINVLCVGPISGINRVWDNKTVLVVQQVQITYTVPVGGGVFNPTNGTNNQTFAQDAGVFKSQAYSHTANDPFGPGPTTLSGQQNISAVKVGSSPGAGQYSVDSSGNYTFSAADAGTVWQIGYWFIQGSPTAPGQTPLGTLAITLFVGEAGQGAWSGIVGQPVPQIGYSEMAYVANLAWHLGTSGTMPNLSFEVSSDVVPQFGGGVVDVEPSAWINYCLTNRNVGNITGSIIGDISPITNYCVANSLFISPVMDTQQTLADYLREYLMIANGDIISSEGLLKFGCYSEQTAVGNGSIYTPATQPQYDLGYDDFLVNGPNEPPIKFTVRAAQDVMNHMSIEWSDRGNEYNYTVLQQEDADSVAKYGRNPISALSAHSICMQSVAAQVLNVQLKREVYMLRECTFTLGWAFSLLEPMDIVTIPEQYPSSNRLAARILEIDEDDNGNLSFKCEILLYGISAPTKHPSQNGTGGTLGFEALPGDVNAPIFFEPPAAMNLGQVLLISLSGSSPNWGGCTVWVSHDGGNNYVNYGKAANKANMGQLTANVNWGTDPDTTNLFSCDLRISLGDLNTVSQAVADAFKNLALVDKELISFEYASLTGSNQYNLESPTNQIYIRRGAYGTPVAAHPSGASFVAIDGNQFAYVYSDAEVGKTLYFKFTSFNTIGQQEEELSNVTAYPYAITLPRPPYPLRPNTAFAPAGPDPLVPSSESFTAKQIFLPTPNGIQPGVDLITYVPPNTYSTVTVPPQLGFVSVSTTGGSLAPGTYYIGVTVLGSDGVESDLSNVIIINVVSGTSTNKITVSINKAHSSDVIWQTYVAFNTLANGFDSQGPPAVNGSNWDVKQYEINTEDNFQAPDLIFDHIVEQAVQEFHAGIWGGEVNVVGTASGPFGTVLTLKFDGGTWSTNQLAGRIVSLGGLITPGLAMPLFNAVIASNTADTLTLDRAGYAAQPGDVFFIRANATIHSPTTIGDTLYVNGGPGQPGTGLTPSAEVGRLVWIIAGTGAGQIRQISANTTTTLTILPAWTVTPDATSVFIIISAGLPVSQATNSGLKVASQPANGLPVPVYDRLPVNQGVGNTYIVILYSADRDGNMSLQQYSPFREIYLYNRWVYPDITGGFCQMDLALADHFEITLTSNTPVTVLPPIWSGGMIIPPSTPITLYIYQDGTFGTPGSGGGHPNPIFQTGTGGFGQDLQVSVNPSITINGAPGTRSVFQLKFHADGLWHLDNFQTGLPPG